MAGGDDIIKQWITRAEQSGDVRKLPGFGVPFNFDDAVLREALSRTSPTGRKRMALAIRTPDKPAVEWNPRSGIN